MASVKWSNAVWGTSAVVSVFGNDELGLVSVTTGDDAPPSPNGIMFQIFGSSFSSVASTRPFTVLTPANDKAAALPVDIVTVSLGPNFLSAKILSPGLTIEPKTTYLWVYHLPKY